MKILVIGGGGREHALAWKIAQSPQVHEVLVAPGNAGTATEAKVRNVVIPATAVPELLKLAQQEHIALTVVGPEAPLAAGIVDEFEAAGLRIFGPRRAAARLEGSKAFAKDFMQRHDIPTAHYQTFAQIDKAKAYIAASQAPLVVKADGLAAGKGVVVANSIQEALEAAEAMMCEKKFGAAGHQIVVEEFLNGEEASFICMVNHLGQILPLATSQDHKARDDGDRGPNTGGMGAYSPAPLLDTSLHQQVIDKIVEPTVRGLAAEGVTYLGFLYCGLMINSHGIAKVLEFNCRAGDPETQPIMMRLQSDLVALLNAAIDGTLDQQSPLWDTRAALGVVMAAAGYPGEYAKGDVINGLDSNCLETRKIFHAGTQLRDGKIVSDGGRVLCVTALGEDIRQAQAAAYHTLAGINLEGAFYRNDIGYRAVGTNARE